MAKYSYNKSHTSQLLAERRHVVGKNFARTITDAEIWQSENNDNVMVCVASLALRDPNDPDSKVKGAELRDWITLPIDNPDVPGHSILDYQHFDMVARNWLDYAAAVWPEECPAPPRRIEVDENKKLIGPYFFRGEEIESDDYKLYQNQCLDLAGPKAAEFAENPTIVIGSGYFCHVRGKEDDSGIFRINQVAYRSELPEWWELETENFVEVIKLNGSGEGEKLVKSSFSSSRRKKAPAKKASKRKASKRRSR